MSKSVLQDKKAVNEFGKNFLLLSHKINEELSRIWLFSSAGDIKDEDLQEILSSVDSASNDLEELQRAFRIFMVGKPLS